MGRIWSKISGFIKNRAKHLQTAFHKKFGADITIDEKRRAFLKYAAFGTAVFLAGKYINPLINAIRGDTVISEKIFENFKITETGKKLLVTDDEGDEILTIDKESF